MTIEKEGIHLQEENQRLREQVAQRDERIQQQESLLCQQRLLMQQMQAQIAALTQHVKDLQDRWPKIATIAACPPPRIALCGSQKACAKRARRKAEGKRDTRERPCALPRRQMK